MIESPVYDWIVEEGLKKGMKKGIEQGLEQGLEQGNIKAARIMIEEGSAIDFIKKVTGLSEGKILELKKELKQN